MTEIKTTNDAIDAPDTRDYTFEGYVKIKLEGEEAELVESKRPRDRVEVQNQGQTPACTVFGATHIHNGLNILEDDRYGKTRAQARANLLWDVFCKDRGFTTGGSSIQTVANWFKKNKYISGYVSIPQVTPLDKMVSQMKQSIDMGLPVYSGSAFGAWSKIKNAGVYEESSPKVFLGHGYAAAVDYVLKDDGTVDYFWAINSYGDKRGPFGGYFKIGADDVKKLYTKIIFLDYDDKDVFAKLQEVEKVKQAVKLLREVYALADKPVRDYLDKVQMGQNFSQLYNTTV